MENKPRSPLSWPNSTYLRNEGVCNIKVTDRKSINPKNVEDTYTNLLTIGQQQTPGDLELGSGAMEE